MLTSIWHCLALWTERAICQGTLLQQLKLKLRKSLTLNTLCYCLYNTDTIIQIYPKYIFFRLHSQNERSLLWPRLHRIVEILTTAQYYCNNYTALRWKPLGRETRTAAAHYFSLLVFFPTCNSVAQSAKAVFTGSGCKTGDNKPHSAFRAQKMHIL